MRSADLGTVCRYLSLLALPGDHANCSCCVPRAPIYRHFPPKSIHPNPCRSDPLWGRRGRWIVSGPQRLLIVGVPVTGRCRARSGQSPAIGLRDTAGRDSPEDAMGVHGTVVGRHSRRGVPGAKPRLNRLVRSDDAGFHLALPRGLRKPPGQRSSASAITPLTKRAPATIAALPKNDMLDSQLIIEPPTTLKVSHTLRAKIRLRGRFDITSNVWLYGMPRQDTHIKILLACRKSAIHLVVR